MMLMGKNGMELNLFWPVYKTCTKLHRFYILVHSAIRLYTFEYKKHNHLPVSANLNAYVLLGKVIYTIRLTHLDSGHVQKIKSQDN